MFDVGFWEFALIGVIALIVVGPERLPGIAKTAGLYFGKFKQFVNNIQADVKSELESDKLKEHLSLEDDSASVVDILDDAKKELDQSRKVLTSNDHQF